MRYVLAGIAAVFLWATTIPLFKSVCNYMDPLCGIGISFSVGGLILSLFTMSQLRQSLRGHPKKIIAAAGLLFFCYELLTVLAIGWAASNRQALEVGLMHYLWPMMMIICSLCLFRQKWNFLLPLGMCCSFAGVIWASTADFSLNNTGLFINPVPYILALMAAVSWGIYSVIVRKFGDPRFPSPIALYTFLCGITFCSISMWMQTFAIRQEALLDLFLLTFTATAGYFMWDYAVSKGNLVVLASVSYFIPLLSILFGSWYLEDVTLNTSLLLGSCAVICGAFLCILGVKEAAAPPEAAAPE